MTMNAPERLQDQLQGQPKDQPKDPFEKIDDCWNRIGIRGDQRCERLLQHVHCRNCEVYEKRAAELLDRIPREPADILVDAEPVASLRRAGASSDSAPARAAVGVRGEGEPLLLFRVGSEWFSLPARCISQVAEVTTIHSLPKLRSKAVLGLANVRGQLTVCVSLARLLDLGDDPSRQMADSRSQGGEGTVRSTARFIVARDTQPEGGREKLADESTVFPVDEVHGIERIERDAYRAVPATLAQANAFHSRAIVDWNGHSVGVLDGSLVFETLRRSLG